MQDKFFRVVPREVLMHRGQDGPLYVHHVAYDIQNANGKTVRASVQPGLVDEICDSLNAMHDEAADSCPVCGGFSSPLGALGRVAHFRCRNCGAEWSK